MSTHSLERIDFLLQRAEAESAGRVTWFEQIDSTNSWLMAQRDIHARVCLTECQTAGRGRRGRVWQAPRASAVLLSIGWDLGAAAAANAASGLSLVSGLATIDGLRRAGVCSIGLKWPNDLIAHRGKLGGVLTELRGAQCVVGVGINVVEPPPSEAQTAHPRTDLQSLGHDIDRDVLAAQLIAAHCRYLRRFCRHGFARFAGEWNRLNVHRGQLVRVELPTESFSGIVRGVDDDGALIVERDGVRRRVISSEASVRSVRHGEKR